MKMPAFQYPSPQQALDALLTRLRPVSTEKRGLSDVGGRILAQDVLADRPSPALDVSVMDGFAFALTDAAGGSLPIAGEAAIGQPPISLAPGTAARIVTGATIPHRADCVLRTEDIQVLERSINFPIQALTNLPPNRNIRHRGENAQPGDLVVRRGTPITAPIASALASLGIHTPEVYRRLRIGVLSTGDEVLAPHETPQPWQLRDGNGSALHQTFGSLPFVEEVESRRVRDDPRQLLAAVAELLSRCDALFLSGGVSMGHRDFVPAALAAVGAETVFHKVPQRPGKPILAAIGPRDQLILGLPGNPVSVLVTAHRFGVAAVRRLAGEQAALPVPSVEVASPDQQTIPLWWHRLVKLNARGQAELVDHRGSGDFIASSRSDGFIEVPPNTTAAGVWPFYAWR
ncbi:MAG: molybdopterin molybdotransferase MoeA [Phycisphaerales bacterium]